MNRTGRTRALTVENALLTNPTLAISTLTRLMASRRPEVADVVASIDDGVVARTSEYQSDIQKLRGEKEQLEDAVEQFTAAKRRSEDTFEYVLKPSAPVLAGLGIAMIALLAMNISDALKGLGIIVLTAIRIYNLWLSDAGTSRWPLSTPGTNCQGFFHPKQGPTIAWTPQQSRLSSVSTTRSMS